jgi:molybdenum cofactor cytidylyltransferase
MTVAIVPACGHSTRMGRPKLALPLGDRSVIERVVLALRAGGVERVLVVVGPHVPELVPLARESGAAVLTLDEATPDMRSTVERGLSWVEEHHKLTPDDWWCLAPGDHPAFPSQVVRDLISLAGGDASCSIVVPRYLVRRGHPVLLRWKHVAGIRALAPGEGINTHLRRFEAELRELPVTDPGVLANLDTPEDYAKLQEGAT